MIAHEHALFLDAYAQLFNRSTGLMITLSLNYLPNLVYASREGSAETVRLTLSCSHIVSTKILFVLAHL